MNVLVINAGSSSLKYQLFAMEKRQVLAKGICERIGLDGRLKHKIEGGKEYKADVPMKNHADALKSVINILTDKEYGVISGMGEIDAVGHRGVHGGEMFSESVVVTDAVIEAIEACVPLAPLHNPAGLTGIRACMEIMGPVPQVVVFDTAFHQTMPKNAYIYAIPYKYYKEHKIRRYGFHGTSHRYVSERVAALMKKPISELKIITCHLGNGSSITAIDRGRSVDTSMGFTPLAGVPMGTRSGDIDPAIIEYICNLEGKDVNQVTSILNKESGVFGISGVSSDFRDLVAAADGGDEGAKLAIEIFLYSIRKYVGAYAAAMGGVDAVAFTAGIGENTKEFRLSICEGLQFMGIHMDSEKNNIRGVEAEISADNSKVKVFVIPTNEELVIALDTERLTKK